MKKQRWRKTKPKMKPWNCDSCGDPIKVYKDYEPYYCCDGFECMCEGRPIDPMFCEDCERIIYGRPIKKRKEGTTNGRNRTRTIRS